MMLKRAGGVLAVCALLAAMGTTPAGAATPPPAAIGAAPPDTTGPEQPMRKNKGNCIVPGVLPASNLKASPAPANTMRLEDVHQFSTGAGVTVAVLSTGVRPQPRLPGMRPGGDYMEESDNGFVDCDGVGTIVAGIIGAQPSAVDGFVGVAPDARILSIRVESAYYQPQGVVGDQENPNSSRTAIASRALARAIVRAANQGARVIVVPEALCVETHKQFDQKTLGGALAYALKVKDALVVTGAGGTDRQKSATAGGGCKDNPDPNPGDPADTRGWDRVTTISTPGWFDDLVLTVGATSAEGVPLPGSMSGPWLDVAAPGAGIVSLSSAGGDQVINGLPGDKGLVAFGGPEYAAAWTAGVAATVRARFPHLRATQVAARIIASAHAPGRGVDNIVGNGLIDPLAALTATLPDVDAQISPESVKALSVPPPPPEPDTAPRFVAAAALVGAVVLVAVGGLLVLAIRPRKGKQNG